MNVRDYQIGDGDFMPQFLLGTVARILNPISDTEIYRSQLPSMLYLTTIHHCVHRSLLLVADLFAPADWKFDFTKEQNRKRKFFDLTAMYGRQPASLVRAIESTNWPDIPKSQSLISPPARRLLETKN